MLGPIAWQATVSGNFHRTSPRKPHCLPGRRMVAPRLSKNGCMAITQEICEAFLKCHTKAHLIHRGAPGSLRNWLCVFLRPFRTARSHQINVLMSLFARNYRARQHTQKSPGFRRGSSAIPKNRSYFAICRRRPSNPSIALPTRTTLVGSGVAVRLPLARAAEVPPLAPPETLPPV